MPPMQSEQIDHIVKQIGQVILGKERQIRLALACLLARGHLLIEDMPGVGKTTLAHTLATVLGLQFQRIQFTSDLLPADILGVSIFDRESSSFHFHPGPIFAQVILADEVNRATPKTQSALLEAMEEHQVTAEGETRPLPEPFFVIATQNPSHQVGTFPLPESQLDRFLMRIELGYPDAAAERALLQGADRRDLLPKLTPSLQPAELAALQDAVRAGSRLGCAARLLAGAGRSHAASRPITSAACHRARRWRCCAAARAWALMEGRNQVLPEDVQAITAGRGRAPAVRRARQHPHQRRGGGGKLDRSGADPLASTGDAWKPRSPSAAIPISRRPTPPGCGCCCARWGRRIARCARCLTAGFFSCTAPRAAASCWRSGGSSFCRRATARPTSSRCC